LFADDDRQGVSAEGRAEAQPHRGAVVGNRLQFVANGVGVSIAPPFVGLDYSEDRLALLPETFVDVWLLTPSGRPPSLASQKLADFIRAAVSPFDQRFGTKA
jgi:DNA-binding transcriptional LysR family regulator